MKMSELVYRSARNSDFANVMDLWRKSFGDFGVTLDTAETLFYDLGTRTDVASRDGDVVGIAMVRVVSGWAELACIAVTPSLHGKGVAEVLLDRCHQYCQRKCLQEVSLHTLDGSSRAKSFFLKNGYKIVPGRLQYPKGQWACRMAVKLS